MNERQAALDEFATQTVTEGHVLAPANITHAPPPALVHGAQKVAVARDEAKVLRRIQSLAHAAGDAWYYRIPYKDRRTGKTTYVEGPSIKLANDVARIYGSCDVDEWVSGEGLDYWEFTARFIDLESGFALTRVFRQRKNAAAVGKDEHRNNEIGFAIGASKAIRNVVTNALQTFADYAYEEARGALVNLVGKDIEKWRREVSERISQYCDIKRVEAIVGRPVRDWLAPDIAMVASLGKTIKDGMATVDDCFPPLHRVEHGEEKAKEQLDQASGDASAPVEEGAADGAPDDSRMSSDVATSPDAAPDHKHEATDKLIALSLDDTLSKEQRLSMLEAAAANWEEMLPPDFFEALVKNCISLVKGHIKEGAARKILETFK